MYEDAGKELEKVLYYYGLIPDVSSTEYKIVCPFHEDVNPSMVVDLVEGKYFCFGCNSHGDAFKFVKSMNKELDDLQALKKLYKIMHSNKVSKIDLSGRKKRRKSNESYYDEACDYYYGLSKVDWSQDEFKEVAEAKLYMKDRGFYADTLNKCEAKITYNKYYPIIFPLIDNGFFKGWVCRTTDKEVEKKRKYLYNKGFSRATTLVGSYGSKNYVFVVEGYMDRLKFIQNGQENVVAILGWKMSWEQIDKLKKAGVEIIISALDNDTCGKKGTEFLKEYFKVIRFKYLKGIKDPGEMTKPLFQKMLRATIIKLKEL